MKPVCDKGTRCIGAFRISNTTHSWRSWICSYIGARLAVDRHDIITDGQWSGPLPPFTFAYYVREQFDSRHMNKYISGGVMVSTG